MSQKPVRSTQQEVCRLEYYARLNHCVIERRKKKKKRVHTKYSQGTDTCLQIHILQYYKSQHENAYQIPSIYKICCQQKLEISYNLWERKPWFYPFLSCSRSWEIFICTTRAIHITAMQILVILKMWNHKILLRRRGGKKKKKLHHSSSPFPPSHRAVCK